MVSKTVRLGRRWRRSGMAAQPGKRATIGRDSRPVLQATAQASHEARRRSRRSDGLPGQLRPVGSGARRLQGRLPEGQRRRDGRLCRCRNGHCSRNGVGRKRKKRMWPNNRSDRGAAIVAKDGAVKGGSGKQAGQPSVDVSQEWVCNACGVANRRSRQVCYKCGDSRDNSIKWIELAHRRGAWAGSGWGSANAMDLRQGRGWEIRDGPVYVSTRQNRQAAQPRQPTPAG